MIVATDAGLLSVENLAVEAEQLAPLADVVVNAHADDDGLCSVCSGVAFPCSSVVLAAASGRTAHNPFMIQGNLHRPQHEQSSLDHEGRSDKDAAGSTAAS